MARTGLLPLLAFLTLPACAQTNNLLLEKMERRLMEELDREQRYYSAQQQRSLSFGENDPIVVPAPRAAFPGISCTTVDLGGGMNVTDCD